MAKGFVQLVVLIGVERFTFSMLVMRCSAFGMILQLMSVSVITFSRVTVVFKNMF